MIGIAVIGLGKALSPHAKALLELTDRCRVVRAAARGTKHTEAAAAAYGFPVTNDIHAAIHDPAVGAVMILTPANTHLEYCEMAFAAGKHVLCEKPLEVSLERGQRLVDAGRRANRRLGVMLQMRFRDASRRLKTLIDSGELGTIQAATLTVPWWRPQSYYDEPGRGVKSRDGGGVLMTQAIHALDLFRWFVGISAVEAAKVRTTALHRMETEDYAAALLRLGNGAPGTMMATVAAYPGSPEQILVIGSKGVARMEASNLRISFLDGRVEEILDDGASGSGSSVMGFSHLPHKAGIADFLDAIEQNRDPAIPGEEALETQRIIDTIVAKGV
jgi:predicted dehydrogenase